MRELEKKIRAYIRQNDMLAPGDRVAAGVSGGADSVCLFCCCESCSGDPF